MSQLEAESPEPMAWYSTISRYQRKILLAAKLGWMLETMDFMLYAIAVSELTIYFGFDDATAGVLVGVVVGQTAAFRRRLTSHIADSKQEGQTPVAAWKAVLQLPNPS